MDVKRVYRYLQGTRDKNLIFNPTKIILVDCYMGEKISGMLGHENPRFPIFANSRTGFVVTLSKFSSILGVKNTDIYYPLYPTI